MNYLKKVSLGAQILDAKINNHDILYFSPLINLDPNKTQRGGMPILFPQFGNSGKLKKHGFARDINWGLNYEKINNQNIVVEYQLFIKENLI
jgi:glucose-6-phosphate 1-epimerase